MGRRDTLDIHDAQARAGQSTEARTGREAPEATASGDTAPLVVLVAIPTVSGLNVREHWRARSRRVARERGAVRLALDEHEPPPLPVVIELTRLGWNEVDDDALPGSLKAVRDEIADWLGLPNDRRREGLTWLYSQRIDRSAARVVRDRRGYLHEERGSVRITIAHHREA
jgi:hypothetical protein